YRCRRIGGITSSVVETNRGVSTPNWANWCELNVKKVFYSFQFRLFVRLFFFLFYLLVLLVCVCVCACLFFSLSNVIVMTTIMRWRRAMRDVCCPNSTPNHRS